MVYFSNGTEGMILDRQCSECPVGEEACPIYAVQQLYNYKQMDKGQKNLREAMTFLIDGKGKCQMREALKRAEGKGAPDQTPIDPKSLPSFLKLEGKS